MWIALGVSVLAALAVASPSMAEKKNEGCALRIGTPDRPNTEQSRRSSPFSATEILDIEIHVLVPSSLSGEHRLDVKLHTPDGELYQVLSEPFSAPVSPRNIVKVVLPVAGTPIVSSSLYGEWTAVAFLDGRVQACSAPRRFVISE